MVYDGNKWNLSNQNETIEDLIDTNEIVIEQKLEEWLENGKEYPEIMKKFNNNLEKKENDVVLNKIKQGKIYNNFLESLSGIQLPLVKHQGSENHYWVYGIVLKSKSRDDLSKHLYDMGIQTRNFFWPLHLQSALPEKYYSQRNLPVSEHIGKNGLYLPLGEHLNENDQRYISKCIRTFMEE